MAEYQRYTVNRKAYRKSRHKKAIKRITAYGFLRALSKRYINKMYWNGRSWIIELKANRKG